MMAARARDELLALQHRDDPFDQDPGDLAELRLEAVRDYFAERVEQVPLLKRLASEQAITEIRNEADIVPLLFSHTTYKSYPHSFLKNQQWDRLQQWMRMVSTRPVNVDTSGIVDVDDWIGRLWQSGMKVATTSATSGKVSFLPRSDFDHAITDQYVLKSAPWLYGLKPDNSLHFYVLSFKGGSHMAAYTAPMFAKYFGRPDSTHYLYDTPLKVADLSAAGELRTRIAEGTATPSEISAAEAENTARSTDARARLSKMAREIIARRKEPMYVLALWGQLWMLVEQARADGIAEGEFHPSTVITGGGGVKGIPMPPDYQHQILGFFGDVHNRQSYGMSEMSWIMPSCEAKRYHQIPWIIPLLLDKSGESLVEQRDGVVEGRFGFIDVSFDARWGGLISGDKVQIDYRRCPCGRPGPTFLPSISRYSDVGDDRIGCAGTIDSYVRGALAE
jgi:hypothetical protein